ncbi:putative chromosome-partitioning protein ParB [bacterium HR17]|uniref:Putative chromosome-partitioning protein ParB n=1 Tax=Candidatus Fervidibacter japonicus TaxID=2035412 RepID=A0A2H5XDG3_9BACT|nr:putative chromosome-partitioning protein ParB [bacterium HR17]
MRRRGLGRGLDALIPTERTEPMTPTETVTMVPVHLIQPNPFQPRQEFRDDELEVLAASIKAHGVLQPVVVRLKDGRYELIAGERRWRAAQRAGLTEIPTVVRQCSDEEMLALALIENLQREDLNPLEEAHAYRALIEQFGFTQEEVARRVGKSRAAVANTLRLLHLPEPIKNALREGVITEGHARALLGAPDEGVMVEAFQTVVRHHLSVRQTEALVRRLTRPHRRRAELDPHILALQSLLEERLQTPVRLRRGRKGGVLEIRYFSDDELTALVQRLVGELPPL